MLTICPTVQPDQTFSSIAARIWLENALPSYRDAAKELFGFPGTNADNLLFAGISHAYDVLHGAGYCTKREWLNQHGYLSLYRPFVPSDLYDYVEWRLLSDDSTFLRKSLALTPFATHHSFENKHYCPTCATQDINTLGFAYARRTFQVPGVHFCHKHGIPLRAVRDDAPQAASQYGILVCDPSELPGLLANTLVEEGVRTSRAQRGFGLWIAALLRGAIPIQGSGGRHAIIMSRLHEMTTMNGQLGSVEQRLKGLLLRAHYLPPASGAASYSYSTSLANIAEGFLTTNRYYYDPVANLLVLSALFDTPEEYAQALASAAPKTIDLGKRIIKEYLRASANWERTQRWTRLYGAGPSPVASPRRSTETALALQP